MTNAVVISNNCSCTAMTLEELDRAYPELAQLGEEELEAKFFNGLLQITFLSREGQKICVMSWGQEVALVAAEK